MSAGPELKYLLRPVARRAGETPAMELVQTADGRRFVGSESKMTQYVQSADGSLQDAVLPDVRDYGLTCWSNTSAIRFVDRQDHDLRTRGSTLGIYAQEPVSDSAAFRDRWAPRCEVGGMPAPAGHQTVIAEVLTSLVELPRSTTTASDAYEGAPHQLSSFRIAIELLVVHRVGATSHMYHFDRDSRELVPISTAHVSLDDAREFESELVILIALDFDRYQWRYRHDRALRHLWFDVGHVLQEVCERASASGRDAVIWDQRRSSRFLANAPLGSRLAVGSIITVDMSESAGDA